MKKLSFFAFALLLTSGVAIASEPGPKERSIGFSKALPDNKFHLGTEKAIQVVKDLDKAWSARDYKAMRTFFADTVKAYFPDGSVTKSADDFIAKVKSQMEGAEVSWTFDYAYSVDLDPTRGGEHVQTGFTGTAVKDGVSSKTSYHEWYYVIEGKVVMWRQYAMKIKEK